MVAPMRFVVGLEADQDVAAVSDALLALGAHSVVGPQPSLPDVLLADFPDGNVDEMVKRIAALPGVRYAEPEQLRFTT
jgi:hypothetical protein